MIARLVGRWLCRRQHHAWSIQWTSREIGHWIRCDRCGAAR